ncbi:TPA: hypothetical protein O8U02_002858 [Enterobacter kobei]|nr:hypothetical protein [Enterobacter kobei]
MAPKKSFRKAYVGIVMDMALARSKISNRMVAQRLGVDETTIRRWRKENIEFERAFTEAREALREKINRVAGKSLDVRKRKVVTTSPDGVKTTIEDVLPTHNDIAVFSKVLGLGTSVYSEEERQRDVLREVMKHKVAGKYSALEAAQLLEAEGVKVPETLLMELGAPKIFEPFNNMDEAAKADAENLTPQEAADIYKKYLG